MTTPAPAPHRPRTERDLCPDCASPLLHGWAANPRDPGDVDPRADCTNPACDFSY